MLSWGHAHHSFDHNHLIFFLSGLQWRCIFPSSELLWYGQVKVTRMILALIRLRWAISWVLSTWVKQFYRCPLAKVIPALCYWISPWSAGVETLKASWDAWIKLGRFPIVLRMFFLCIIGYNWILGIVWNCSSVPCHGLALNPTFAISRSFRGIFYITSVMCCTFRFAWLGISLRCSLSRSFVCTSFHTNEKSGKPQCFGLAIFLPFRALWPYFLLSLPLPWLFPQLLLHLFCSWVESLTSKTSFLSCF